MPGLLSHFLDLVAQLPGTRATHLLVDLGHMACRLPCRGSQPVLGLVVHMLALQWLLRLVPVQGRKE